MSAVKKGNSFLQRQKKVDTERENNQKIVENRQNMELENKDSTKSSQSQGSDEEKEVLIAVRVTAGQRKKLKIHCVENGTTMEKAVRSWIDSLESI